MLRSLYAGVSGMRSFQTKMDVVANNIANVNTTGFKSSRVKFQDMISQTIANAMGPSGGLGGVNPQQVGLGVRVGSIDTMMGGGALQSTGRNMDFALEGEGFFILQGAGGVEYYSRDGAFFTDHEGLLINASGLPLLGYGVEGGHSNGDFAHINISTDGETSYTTGGLKKLKVYQWVQPDGTVGASGSENYELQEFSIDSTGKVVGIYSNAGNQEAIAVTLGYVALTKFNNPEGLTKVGNNNYLNSNNSGEPEYGLPGGAGYGFMRQSFLEMSNVDLANEFTEMIITSRAYQANSRSITTSDEMLMELINLKR